MRNKIGFVPPSNEEPPQRGGNVDALSLARAGALQRLVSEKGWVHTAQLYAVAVRWAGNIGFFLGGVFTAVVWALMSRFCG